MNNVIQAAREKEQEAWRKVHDTEAKYQEGGDLMKELEAVRRERDERQANVNELRGKIRRVRVAWALGFWLWLCVCSRQMLWPRFGCPGGCVAAPWRLL